MFQRTKRQDTPSCPHPAELKTVLDEASFADDDDGAFDALIKQAVASCAPMDEHRMPPVGLITPGTLVGGRYEVAGVLGSGGMGVVFAGRDRKLGGKPIALKWLRSAPTSATSTRRFLREAVAAGPIVHPNVVAVYDFGFHDDRPYLVMELLEGEPLSARIAREPFAIGEALQIALGIVRGVAAVHARGIVHRDLKPCNVFLCEGFDRAGVVPKVLDFGIAKLSVADFGRLTLTRPDIMLGTPHYMAPEVIRGEPIDARTDVYGVAVMLYQMLTGRLPYDAKTEYDLYRHILQGSCARPRSLRADLPHDVEAVIVRGMALDPAARFSGMPALRSALEAALRRRARWWWLPRPATPAIAVAIGAALLCALVMLTVLVTLAGPEPRALKPPPPLPTLARPDSPDAL